MPLAQIVPNIQTGHLRGELFARLLHPEELAPRCPAAPSCDRPAAQRDLRHRVLQHARRDRMALGVIGVEQALRRRAFDHLRQLPAEVHRVLHTDVEALPADRRVHVRGVAREQHPSVAIRRGLPRHVGEPGDPGGLWTPKSVPYAAMSASLRSRSVGSAVGSDVRFGHMTRTARSRNDFAVADLVLHLPKPCMPSAS